VKDLRADLSASLRALLANRKAAFGAAVVAAFALTALVGPAIVSDPRAFVSVPHEAPSWAHWLGTTGQGQDVLAQTVAGARTTLLVGFGVGAFVTIVGAFIGITAAVLGGRADAVLSVLTNVFLVIPGLPLAIVLAAYLPPGPGSIALVLSFAGWAWSARVFRAQALALRNREFIQAAIVSGEGPLRVVFVELLPNMASLVASAFIGTTVYAIGAEVGLEFLGLGDPGAVTWGTNLYWASNDSALLTGAWWTFVPTGVCVALVGFALTMLSYAIDEVTNPRLAAGAPRVDDAAPTAERSTTLMELEAAPLLDFPREEVPPEERSKNATPPPSSSPLGPAAGALLSVRGLTVRHRGSDRLALDGVTVDLMPGEIFGLAGESGSGKSTFGDAVLRLLPPGTTVSGEVRFADKDVFALGEEELRAFRFREVSVVMQSALDALNPVATVADQIIDVILAHHPFTRPAARERAATLLHMVGLETSRLDSFPHTLSGGARQRVALALALALDPRLVILDEATTALDVVTQRELLDRIAELRATLGLSVLFITHDLPLLIARCDRVGVLYRGRLIDVAPASHLPRVARHPYTRKLLSAFPSLGPGPGQTDAGVAPSPLPAPGAPAAPLARAPVAPAAPPSSAPPTAAAPPPAPTAAASTPAAAAPPAAAASSTAASEPPAPAEGAVATPTAPAPQPPAAEKPPGGSS
jgi:ABC-type dipeptide/oligopeptide/nickel transport system ATPase component/ABC-type dipeptide/oligopeptide/nickel transport system permease subunit